MKSPFPGMDPYIEVCGLWEDFHGHLINAISERLADVVPDRYLIRTPERSYLVLVESEGKTSRPFRPDVSVTTSEGRKKSPRRKGGTAVAEAAAEAEPITMRALIAEEHREAFVEIYEANPEQRLVTSIEVLSPTNKRPNTAGWEEYQHKRQSLLLGGVNLVEIDLLRGGQSMPMHDPWPESSYRLLVARAYKPDLCRVWTVHLAQRLPVIPVPLAKPDPDIPLDIQPMIEAIYRRYRYDHTIDYSKKLSPPPRKEEAAWLEGQLRGPKKEA